MPATGTASSRRRTPINFWSSPNLNGTAQGIGLLLEYLDDNGMVLFCPNATKDANSLWRLNYQDKIQQKKWLEIRRFGYTYHAGCVDTSDDGALPTNWSGLPFGHPPLALGGMTPTFKANDKSLISMSKILSARPGSPIADGVLLADWIGRFDCGDPFFANAVNHPLGGPMVGGRSGANVVHGDGHIEWYSYPTDIISDWWCTYALWKPEYVAQ
jgi:hypothetical protein